MNRKFIVIAGAVMLAALLAACSHSSTSNGRIREAQEASAGINLIIANQPVPIFPTSELRAEMIQVEAIQALGTPTTTFFYPEGTSGASGHVQPVKTCPSKGMPIPNTASLSNPEQLVPDTHPGHNNSTSLTMPLMEPNGIYPPAASSGTYVLCLDSNGQDRASYWEGPVETESGSAVYDKTTGQIRDIGPSQLPVCTLGIAKAGNPDKIKAGTRYYHCVKA